MLAADVSISFMVDMQLLNDISKRGLKTTNNYICKQPDEFSSNTPNHRDQEKAALMGKER